MALRTVKDLKKHLLETKVSPETMGRDVKVSNMTIRRLLRKGDSASIPEKYHLAFDEYLKRAPRAGANNSLSDTLATASMTGLAARLLVSGRGGDGQDFDPLIEELERSGRAVADVEALESEVNATVKTGRLDQRFKSHIKEILSAIRSAQTTIAQRAICVGALVYLVNPIDLIPDSIPVVGYLDDFAVLALVVAMLAKSKVNTPKSANATRHQATPTGAN